jgi:hypothetical protein
MNWGLIDNVPECDRVRDESVVDDDLLLGRWFEGDSPRRRCFADHWCRSILVLYSDCRGDTPIASEFGGATRQGRAPRQHNGAAQRRCE